MFPDAEGPVFLLLTCEHGGREVPPRFRRAFRDAGEVLRTHRGFDIGALGVAQRVAARLAAPLVFSTVTRLLVDLNRSPDAPGLFSEFSRELADEEKRAILDEHYLPHRSQVASIVEMAVRAGRPVLHVGVHSCTDVLDGRVRDLDTALLFDPDHGVESALCTAWQGELEKQAGHLRHRFNEPYKGTDDGLTTTLRGRFEGRLYAGIEVEVRQGLIHHAAEQKSMGDLLAATLAPVLRASHAPPMSGA